MQKIIKLDKNLANQISAWEVVERPVSVVKELVENSVDAWATEIKIEIKEWWTKEIIISDNWQWINKEDLPLTIEKYSTSKIKSINDLYNIMTFGFRWEALASISSVSDFSMISKTTTDDFGSHLEIDNEWTPKIKKHPSDTWTKVIIKNLFHNTPARLNYLKTQKTEYNHILEFLNNISLSYPEIWFEFISDEKQVFIYNKLENLKTRIYKIFGSQFTDNLLELDFSSGGISLNWYISDPKVSWANKNRQCLCVNHRIIKSPIIYKAINDAYNRFIPHGNFPAYVINLDIDPTEVDVNVHPRKMEVRFAYEQNIFRSVYNSINSKLTNVTLVQNSDNSSFQDNIEKLDISKFTKPEKFYTWSGTKFKSYSPYKDTSANPMQSNISDAISFSKEILNLDQNSNSFISDLEFPQNSTDLYNTPVGKIIWQIWNSYIIVETKDKIKILDQHALAERIIYERLLKSHTHTTQWLLVPENINLTPQEIWILEEKQDIFREIWFDYEIMWSSIVILSGVPDFLGNSDTKEVFLWVIDDIWTSWLNKSKKLDEVKNKIFAYTACRSAIKFGHKLNIFEMNKLLNDSIIDYSSTCPHGRPVIFEFWLDELKNKFER